jgi:antirestriction protein ArdC
MIDLYQDVTDRIVAAIEAGTPPWDKAVECFGLPSAQCSHTEALPRRKQRAARARGRCQGLRR